MTQPAFTIGVDFGTNSVRALIVDCADGREVATAVVDYPSGEAGVLLDDADPHFARQNPADYIGGLERSVCGAIEAARSDRSFSADRVIGIGADTTGSTPIPVDARGRPLALDPRWANEGAAHAWLWKDHTGAEEAARITELAREHRPQYLAKCGDAYSSEWFWSKIWRCLNVAPDVFDAAHGWVELADFVPALLAGVGDPRGVRRGVCAAGHKAMYCDEWGGLPDKEFLALLDPRLADLRDRLFDEAFDASEIAGRLCVEWAKRLGLREGIPIAIGAFDAHWGAIGAGVAEGVLVKIIGTSTCDCTVISGAKKVRDIPGICGIVRGSILPGDHGVEAGQSAVGDIFKWFAEGIARGGADAHDRLTREAAALAPGQSGLLALDWNNGNRTILVDPMLSGLLVGQTLRTTPAEIYRALIEATAFGARAIVERLRDYGAPIERIVCCGGIAEKNPLLMQIYADATGCEMQISRSAQTCALGAAIGAAVAAGRHESFARAQACMTGVKDLRYAPDAARSRTYDRLYELYRRLHDGFGGVAGASDFGRVMKDLFAIRADSLARRVESPVPIQV
jgi:L-ribulokinase